MAIQKVIYELEVKVKHVAVSSHACSCRLRRVYTITLFYSHTVVVVQSCM